MDFATFKQINFPSLAGRIVFFPPELETVIKLLEIQLVDLVELLNLGVREDVEVGIDQSRVGDVHLVGVQPLGLKNV